MQEVLEAIQTDSNWAGLNFNPKKCGTLTLSRSAHQFAETFSPTINGEQLPSGSFHGLSGMNWTAPLRFVCNLSYLLDLIWMLL